MPVTVVPREKQRKHHHYLKSTVFCGGCGERMCLTNAKGTYLYFFCIGHHQRRSACRQRYVLAEKVSAMVEDYYQQVQVDPKDIDRIRKVLHEELAGRRHQNAEEVTRQRRRLNRLSKERQKLLQAHYSDAIPLEIS